MGILDEDKNLFTNIGTEHVMARITDETGLIVSSMHFVRCTYSMVGSNGCAECIGHKYNLEYGCPVCGADVARMTVNGSAHICNVCGSASISCGLGDVAAVGMIDKMFLIEEDII